MDSRTTELTQARSNKENFDEKAPRQTKYISSD